MFGFNTCSVDFIAKITSACDTSTVPLNVKPHPNSLKYAFLGPNELSPMVIALNLDQDQEGKLSDLLRENKEALGWTLGDIKVLALQLCNTRSI